MTFDNIIDTAYRSGGRWLKLTEVGDKITGDLLDIEEREKRDLDGNIVLGKKSGTPRTEWVVTIQTDDVNVDDDGVRKFSANESAQKAIKEAIKRAGIKSSDALNNAKFAIQLVAAAPDKFSQGGYTAQIKPNTTKPISIDDLFD
jgi:hypothetical protein